MSIISRMRKQDAVYWALASTESGGVAYDDYGQPQLADPVAITVRWSDVIEEFIDANGSAQVSQGKVFVDRDMVTGEVLMLGELTDITDSVNVKENDGAMEIRKFSKIPNLRATESLRKALL